MSIIGSPLVLLRIGAAVTVTSLTTALLVVILPSPAHADGVPCPAFIASRKRFIAADLFVITGYELISATPRFFPSDSRSVENSLDTPITVQFTSSQSQTFTLTVTAGITAKVNEFLSTTVSTTVTQSRTTSIGVNVTATIPPRTQVVAEYGVDGFDVVYLIKSMFESRGVCLFSYADDVVATGTTPTINERWRIRTV